MSLFIKALYIVKSSTNLYVYGLLLSQEPNILNKARFIQFSRIRIFVEDNDIASVAKNKNGKQHDFNSSTEIISE